MLSVHLQDAIHQQKWVTVGQQAKDLLNVYHGPKPSFDGQSPMKNFTFP